MGGNWVGQWLSQKHVSNWTLKGVVVFLTSWSIWCLVWLLTHICPKKHWLTFIQKICLYNLLPFFSSVELTLTKDSWFYLANFGGAPRNLRFDWKSTGGLKLSHLLSEYTDLIELQQDESSEIPVTLASLVEELSQVNVNSEIHLLHQYQLDELYLLHFNLGDVSPKLADW